MPRRLEKASGFLRTALRSTCSQFPCLSFRARLRPCTTKIRSPELAQLLRTAFAEGDTAYIATDGSEKDDVAAWALFLPAGGHRVARQCLGQDQTAFRAEAEAIRTCLLAVQCLAAEGVTFRGKTLCLVSDCQAAISLVTTGEASCLLLARELLQLKRDADRLLRICLQWVPSHGKQSPDFQGPVRHLRGLLAPLERGCRPCGKHSSTGSGQPVPAAAVARSS